MNNTQRITCSFCKQPKLPDAFCTDPEKRNGKASMCRDCHNQRRRESYRNNPKTKEVLARYRKQYPERRREYRRNDYRLNVRPRRLAERFNITVEEYDALFELQGGVCAICRLTSNIALAVDHCHQTGRVRGLLCNSCNLALGNFKDDPLRLKSALNYLLNPDLDRLFVC